MKEKEQKSKKNKPHREQKPPKDIKAFENRVRELAKIKGIKISELAERVGMGHGNFLNSIRSNPKLSTLEEIANALNVKIADIVEPQRVETDGIVIINGETYSISKPQPDIVKLPHFKDYTILKNNIKIFIKTSIISEEERAICGYVEMLEFFNLFYDADNKTFSLTLCYGNGLIYTRAYPCLEYGDGDRWDVEDVIMAIWCDIESIVPTILGTNPENITQEDIDKVVKRAKNKVEE